MIDYSKLNSKSLKALLETDGFGTMWGLSNPPVEEQVLACSIYSGAIRYLTDPSDEAKIKILERHHHWIKEFPDSSDAVKLAAIRKCGHAIKYMNDPTEDMIREAVRVSPRVIKEIKNPSLELMELAVRTNPETFSAIWRRAPLDLQILAVELLPWNIVNVRSHEFPLELAERVINQHPTYLSHCIPKLRLNPILRHIAITRNPKRMPEVLKLTREELALAISLGYRGPKHPNWNNLDPSERHNRKAATPQQKAWALKHRRP